MGGAAGGLEEGGGGGTSLLSVNTRRSMIALLTCWLDCASLLVLVWEVENVSDR